MGLIGGLIKRLFKLVIYSSVIVAIVIFIPNLPPYTKFTAIVLEPTQQRVGPLQPNEALNNAEQLYKGKLLGPEAFEIYKGELYTSLLTGEIVKISPGGHITFVTKIGQPCTDLTQTQKCGRALGFQIDENNNLLYVADAYHGIWKVNLRTDKKELLVSPRVEIEGRKPRLFNSIALTKNGDIYWTDSTSDFELHDGAYSLLTDPSGRLFHYVAAKNQSRVLLDDLWFANGVVLSPDNQFLLVAETGRYRVLKYYIDGPKKGKSEVFVSGLPGTPDNLRVLPDGSGLLASLYTSFDEQNPLITKSMANTPVVRKFLARLQRLIEIPFEFLNTQFPNAVFDDIVYNIGNFKSVASFSPGISGFVQIDWNGNIVASYYNNDGTLKAVSDVIVYNDKLYIGAPNSHDFIGAVPAPPSLIKAFSSVKTTPPPKTVTNEVPKPKGAMPIEEPSTEKPKVVQKNEAPVPKVDEKKATPPPPQQKQARPVETVKVKPTEKPSEPKPTTPKPTAAPKTTETKPTTTPKPVTIKKTEENPKPTTPTPKVEPKVSPTPKPETATPKEATKPTTPKPAVEKKPGETKKSTNEKSQEKREIPIKEEIPSDTIKPTKETLKVIKKDGPAEIPNPHL